ncbi:hypothetical protein [Glutamicibacter sp.]|uniref:hypothetical protein n=1 Tax=Glutamicibacter sp. TaxID=1931995 RepID=UPI002FE12511
MLNFSGENTDDELTYLVNSTVESHQVVTIGSVEDLGRNSVNNPESTLTLASTNTGAPNAQYESLDDWF